jgi:hypothetical protein
MINKGRSYRNLPRIDTDKHGQWPQRGAKGAGAKAHEKYLQKETKGTKVQGAEKSYI